MARSGGDERDIQGFGGGEMREGDHLIDLAVDEKKTKRGVGGGGLD